MTELMYRRHVLLQLRSCLSFGVVELSGERKFVHPAFRQEECQYILFMPLFSSIKTVPRHACGLHIRVSFQLISSNDLRRSPTLIGCVLLNEP